MTSNKATQDRRLRLAQRLVVGSALVGAFASAACGIAGSDDSDSTSAADALAHGVDAGPLTCDCLKADTNCWSAAIDTAADCLPQASPGYLSPDLASCSFASGQYITFDEPLTLPLPPDYRPAFAIRKHGVACMKYNETL